MGRKPLVLASVLVVIAGAALYLQLRGDGPPPAAPPPAKVAPTVAGSGGAATVQVTDTPRLPDSPTPATAAGSDGGVTEYAVGDVIVRDHRAGPHTRLDTPPDVHPPGGRRLPPALTNDIGQKMRAAALACAADIPREARGPDPRIEGEAVISIVDKQLKVTGSTLALRDVAGASVEPTMACVQQKLVGLATAAADQDDLDRYAITVRFALP
jgi:hypothetical protein